MSKKHKSIDEYFSAFTKDMHHCYICGESNANPHHIMNGANKTNSEKCGLIIPLCLKHHTGAEGVHTHPEKMLEMRKMAQRKFEESHSREEWIKTFGKSYL